MLLVFETKNLRYKVNDTFYANLYHLLRLDSCKQTIKMMRLWALLLDTLISIFSQQPQI